MAHRRSTRVIHVSRNVWTVATWLVAKHGPAASKVVTARITRLREDPVDASAITSWLLVDQAIHELMREPHEGEPVN